MTTDLENICEGCNSTVYDAEGTVAGGRKFHKKCLKCHVCKKRLDPVTLELNDKKVTCKTCNKKTLFTEVPKLYQDTKLIQSSDSNSCPRCNGAVFEAEKIAVKDDVYHKQCFSCTKCARPLDLLGTYVTPDKNIYCKVCFKQVTLSDRPIVPVDTTVIPAEDEREGCPRCGGKVFEAEKMTTKVASYHKKCFTCGKCKRQLNYQTLVHGPDSDIYCTICYSQIFGHKAKHTPNVSDVAVIPGEEGSVDECKRCHGKVFEAEKQMAKKGLFHTKCFTCIKCKRQLDPSNFANGPDDVYCLYCYRVTHGHKAITRSTPLDTTSIAGDLGDKRRCPRCGGKVFEAEKMVAASGWYHRHCFRCSFCSQPVDSTSVCDGPDNKIYCRVCYRRLRGSSKPRFYDGANVDTQTIQAEDENSCPRCNGRVFEAEKMVSMRHVYHKKCFTCFFCSRPLDPFIACDAPDGEVVCRPCYEKNYSCRAFNLSGADMLKLLDTSILKGEENDACPRCQGKVFHAEKIATTKKMYHKRCFSCNKCAKMLASGEYQLGTDDEAYCRACYARNFGSPGYRGAGCGEWTDEESAKTLRPVQNVDVSKIKGVEGDENTCNRCSGKIFESERKASSKAYWHKKCFNCFKCHRIFDFINSFPLDASNGEIYCKNCFKKEFPKAEIPLLYNDTSQIKPEQEDQGCPKCGGAVFQAEEILVKGRSYHKKCLHCHSCNRQIDNILLKIGPDDNPYCKICCDKISWPNNYLGPSSIEPSSDLEGNECPRCNAKVFEAEKVNTTKNVYHKKCFSCLKCHRKLDSLTGFEGPNSEIFCKVCFQREFNLHGKNLYGIKCQNPSEVEDATNCIRCKGKVFEAEKVLLRSGLIHTYCLSCADCKCNLDASTFFEGKDGDVYCKLCYSTKFGHKQKSNYKAWMDVTQIKGNEGDLTTCPRCSGKVFEAEKMVTRYGQYHKNCFSCLSCEKKLDSTTVCEGPDAEIYCNSCYANLFGVKGRVSKRKGAMRKARSRSVPKLFATDEDILARSLVETWVIKAEEDDMNRCPKCEGKVFDAEKMVSTSGNMYHKNCFRCRVCEKQLDSLTCNDGSDGKIYCKKCYIETCGPQTRALDVDLKILDTSIFKSEDEKKNCPRCKGSVFKAEEVPVKNRSFHKKCLTCLVCKQKLEQSTLSCDNNGEIYCQNCYAKKFGSVGYRGTGCKSWLNEDASATFRHSFQAF